MSSEISTVDQYKLDATFHDGTVVHTTRLVGGQCIAAPKATWARETKLGAGGFGVVWLEREGGSGQLRAVKVVSKLQLNVREVQAMVELQDHPRLFVIFLGWFEDPHSVYLTMEYIEHGDLAQYIKTHGAKAAIEGKEITSQVLRALVVLHSREICHRDLKPANILIISRSPIWVKITDFGISKQSTGTSLRTGCGTPSYQAPELLGLLPNHMRVGRSRSYTKVVDLWALGAIVHQILTTEIPFLDTYDGSDWTTTEDGSIPSWPTAEPDNLPATVDTAMLYGYCCGSEFPTGVLEKHKASDDAIALVKRLMAVNPKDRISAADALQSKWLFKPQHELRRQLQRVGRDVSLDDANELAEASRGAIMDILHAPAMSEIRDMMFTAVEMGLLEVIQLLLKVIDEISSCSGLDNTSFLMIAALKNQVPAMTLLLQSGANINASVKPYYRTALHEAAAAGHLEAMKVLLDSGANANMQQDHERGESALYAATAGGHIEAMKLLLERGAAVNDWAPTEVGQTPLYVAPTDGELQAMVQRSAGWAKVTEPAFTRRNQLPLHAAAAGGHLDAIELLLDAGANVNDWALHEHGQTPLQGAAATGNLEAMKLLLSRGANATEPARTHYGETPMHAAHVGGHLGAMKLLFKHVCAIEARTPIEHQDPGIIAFLDEYRQSLAGWVFKYSVRKLSAGERCPSFCDRVSC